MNPVIESLLEIVDRDPLPVEYASSHWQRYGRETIVERRGDDLVLRGSGFGVVYASGRRWQIVHALERLSYRRVIARLNSFASVWRTATDLARDLSFDLTFDVWKQSGALAVLTDHWRAYGLTPKIFTLIGDGYGFLGALIRRCRPGARIYCIDLPKTLVFQVRTHERAARDAAMSLLSANGGHQTDTVFVLPGDIELIPDQIDCAVNIASMQEMNVTSIASYFAFLRRRSTLRSRFYCVNRMRKQLPEGEVSAFAEYPWQGDDEVFIDGQCPFYSHFLAPYTLPNGPRLFGVRIPYINYFDGIHLHRLARLAPLS